MIVSNPPYIPAAEYEKLAPDVRDYEPRIALLRRGGRARLLPSLIPGPPGCLVTGGLLAVEVGAGEAAAVRELFAAAGAVYGEIDREDLGGAPRVVVGREKPTGSPEPCASEKVRAVVLSSCPLGEADRILVLFTRELGRVDAVVKGVRKTKSSWGGRLEPFNVCDLVCIPAARSIQSRRRRWSTTSCGFARTARR